MPAFLKALPDMRSLSKANEQDLAVYLKSVTNFLNKSKWLIKLAGIVRDNKNIPTTMEKLVGLPGIGRKSANVIMSESGLPMEGIIVDLHVVRVAPRIGVATGSKPEKIESQLMEIFPKERWKEVGMGLTFLGREICGPSNPKCGECPLNSVCEFYRNS